MTKSKFKCPKCKKSTLKTAKCNDNISIVSCENKDCEFYTEMNVNVMVYLLDGKKTI